MAQHVYEAEGTPWQLAEGIRQLPDRKYKITVQYVELDDSDAEIQVALEKLS